MARKEFSADKANKELLEAFRKTIIDLKQASRLKQKSIAEKSGLDHRYLQNLLSVKEIHNPSLDTMYKLVKAFNISLAELSENITKNYNSEDKH
ncbi:MAG: helix-turn-helix transcriptional regulator [Candidatus Margulisiibacteriota bacterium]|jgi:transcriptional regulator with XRE-family HTH domain